MENKIRFYRKQHPVVLVSHNYHATEFNIEAMYYCVSIVITDHKIIVAKNQLIDQAVLLTMIILIILLDFDIFTLYMISFITCFIKSA